MNFWKIQRQKILSSPLVAKFSAKETERVRPGEVVLNSILSNSNCEANCESKRRSDTSVHLLPGFAHISADFVCLEASSLLPIASKTNQTFSLRERNQGRIEPLYGLHGADELGHKKHHEGKPCYGLYSRHARCGLERSSNETIAHESPGFNPHSISAKDI
jgi:hypothetical protein